MSFLELFIAIDEQFSEIFTIISAVIALLAWIFPADVIRNHRRKILSVCLFIIVLLALNHFIFASTPKEKLPFGDQQVLETTPPHDLTHSQTESSSKNEGNLQAIISLFYNQTFSYIDTYYANRITITTEKQGLILFANGIQMWGQGFYTIDDIPVKIYLIDYNTKSVVDCCQSYIGETIRFTEVPEGTYFYVIISDGHTPSFPSNPFTLIASEAQNDLPTLTAFVKETGIEDKPRFDVQVVDLQGNIVPNTELEFRIAESKNLEPSHYVHCTGTTDPEGFLVPNWTVNPFEYDTKFVLGENCILQVSSDGVSYYNAVPSTQNRYVVKGNW